jgi:hypothetical protein
MDMNMHVADLRPLQIPLVQSVTEDEDDDSPTKYDEHEHVDNVSSEHHHPHENMNHPHHYSVDPHAALVDQVRSARDHDNNTNNSREALAYLLRYETMVRQQEAEDMATIDHMRPCVERLQELAGMNMNENTDYETAHTEDVLTQEISYGQLKTALKRLEQSQHGESENATAANSEFMTTDRQLMMVLRLLTKSVPATSTSDSDTDTDSATTSEEDQDNNSHLTITWAEFLQCYKTCIVGMLTLQHLPANANSQVRARTRDRTLSMLSLFQPPTTFAGAASSNNNNGNDNLLSLRQHAQAFDVRRPGVDRLATAPSSSSRRLFKNLNSKKKQRAIMAVAAALTAIIMIMAPASTTYSGGVGSSSSNPFEVDPIVVTNNGVEIASEDPSASILQTVFSFTSNKGKEASMLVQQQQQPKQQSMPSTFFSRTPLVVEKRGAVPVRQAVTSPTTAPPLTAPHELMTLPAPHPTNERIGSVAPAMIGGVVGCLGAPLLVAGLQGTLNQAAVTATAIGGSASAPLLVAGLQGILKQAAVTATAIGGSASAIIGSTGLLVPVLAGMGALLAVTSVVRGIWAVLNSLMRH